MHEKGVKNSPKGSKAPIVKVKGSGCNCQWARIRVQSLERSTRHEESGEGHAVHVRAEPYRERNGR